MSKESKHTKKPKWTYLRHGVQILMVLFFLLPLLAVGWPLVGAFDAGDALVSTPAQFVYFGSLTASGILGITLLDPLAFLETLAAVKTIDVDWLIYVAPVVVFYALVRGRAFCGWVCPVNLVLEFTDWLREKLHIKVSEAPVPRHVKLWVALGVIVLSALFSVPLFETFSPLGFVHRFLLFGSLAGVATFVAIVLVELFWGHRVWCRALCPIGGVYEAVGRVGLLTVAYDAQACTHCNACKRACLCDPVILDECLAGTSARVSAGDCMVCGSCIDACPEHALFYGFTPRHLKAREDAPKGPAARPADDGSGTTGPPLNDAPPTTARGPSGGDEL